ncbi:MAG: hypothetical protein RL280_1524 [Actinomycetota bacterium]|jgi:hypothetical protein
MRRVFREPLRLRRLQLEREFHHFFVRLLDRLQVQCIPEICETYCSNPE